MNVLSNQKTGFSWVALERTIGTTLMALLAMGAHLHAQAGKGPVFDLQERRGLQERRATVQLEDDARPRALDLGFSFDGRAISRAAAAGVASPGTEVPTNETLPAA